MHPASPSPAQLAPIPGFVAANEVEFEFEHAELGRFWLRTLRLPEDLPLVHSWVTHEKARYWGMVGKSLSEVLAGYRVFSQTARVFIGYHQQQPAFLVETYFPGDDPVGAHYAVQAFDRGMHLLLAPSERPRHGFGWAVFCVVMEFLFSDPGVRRIVVEPDITNVKIHALNRRACRTRRRTSRFARAKITARPGSKLRALA
jgi:RimJ/RimL family protein N-acetyltransferase